MTDLFQTLHEARERLFASPSFKTGSGRHECPCCGQNVKLRNRRLNSGMAATLCWLVREFANTQDWINVQARAPRFALRGREVSRLALWGLTEAKANHDNPKQRDSGLWRPTPLGIDFVCGAVQVPTHARTFNRKCVSLSDEFLTIREALSGGPFDYEELMGQRPEDVKRKEAS